jgi:hypothetical protein
MLLKAGSRRPVVTKLVCMLQSPTLRHSVCLEDATVEDRNVTPSLTAGLCGNRYSVHRVERLPALSFSHRDCNWRESIGTRIRSRHCARCAAVLLGRLESRFPMLVFAQNGDFTASIFRNKALPSIRRCLPLVCSKDIK